MHEMSLRGAQLRHRTGSLETLEQQVVTTGAQTLLESLIL